MTENRNTAVIGTYMGSAGRVPGADLGARRLKESIAFGGAVRDAGDIIPAVDPGTRKGLRNLDRALDVSCRLRDRAADAFRAGEFVLNVGGDHACALGSIAAACEAFGPEHFGVLYLDAHGDINTPETSPSGNIHGMSLAAALGYGDPELQAVAPVKVRPCNVLFVGTRALDPGEEALAAEERMGVITAHDIRFFGVEAALERIWKFLWERQIHHLHFSIDIDVVDPGEAPGTGVRVKHGLRAEEFLEIVHAVRGLGILRSADLVEFIPALDRKGRTELLCREVLDAFLA